MVGGKVHLYRGYRDEIVVLSIVHPESEGKTGRSGRDLYKPLEIAK